jgi:hypothetical protein
MLNCRQTVMDAERLLAGEMRLPERIRIRMHLLICHHCRRYVRQLQMLLQALPLLPHRIGEDQVETVLKTVTSAE